MLSLIHVTADVMSDFVTFTVSNGCENKPRLSVINTGSFAIRAHYLLALVPILQSYYGQG